jgi:O-succinylbenzoic acid--CoA ligase
VSLGPTALARIVPDRFRTIVLGGTAPPANLPANAVITYGLTETGSGVVYDGRPLDGVEVRLDDEVVHIRGPVLMSGYRLRPDLTADALVDGWFRTQDVGSFDSTGRLHVHGRVDDIVVTGGENVVLTAVEHALAAHPLVRDAAVVAVPDDEWGQRVVAVVVTDSAASSSELRDWVKERLGRASAPRDVLVVDRIPLLASGKPDRAAIRASAQAGRDSG